MILCRYVGNIIDISFKIVIMCAKVAQKYEIKEERKSEKTL